MRTVRTGRLHAGEKILRKMVIDCDWILLAQLQNEEKKSFLSIYFLVHLVRTALQLSSIK